MSSSSRSRDLFLLLVTRKHIVHVTTQRRIRQTIRHTRRTLSRTSSSCHILCVYVSLSLSGSTPKELRSFFFCALDLSDLSTLKKRNFILGIVYDFSCNSKKSYIALIHVHLKSSTAFTSTPFRINTFTTSTCPRSAAKYKPVRSKYFLAELITHYGCEQQHQ